jgi:hypothetical protein
MSDRRKILTDISPSLQLISGETEAERREIAKGLKAALPEYDWRVRQLGRGDLQIIVAAAGDRG